MRKRRHRIVSIEKQIADKARAIQKDGMAEIIRTATLIVVGQKLEELTNLLRAAGVGQSVATSVLRPVAESVPTAMPAVQRPCAYCGLESIKRVAPDGRWIKKEMWLCRGHLPMARQHERKMTEPVAELVPGVAPDKPDTGGDVGIADAFAAVGIQTNVN